MARLMARRDVDFALLRSLPGRRVVTAAAGETLLREGESGGELHVIVSGKVRLVRGGEPIAELGAGELLGEIGLLAGGTHPYGAVAEAASTLIAVPAATALGAIAQSPKFATGLAQTAADRALQLAAAGAAEPAATPPPAAATHPSAAATQPPAAATQPPAAAAQPPPAGAQGRSPAREREGGALASEPGERVQRDAHGAVWQVPAEHQREPAPATNQSPATGDHPTWYRAPRRCRATAPWPPSCSPPC
jgi:hypothetical protein